MQNCSTNANVTDEKSDVPESQHSNEYARERKVITALAQKKIKAFNSNGLHYNLVADAVYKHRKSITDPCSEEYQHYITAGLLSFDMNRMMGQGGKYDLEGGGFATSLQKKLCLIQPAIKHLFYATLIEVDVEKESRAIIEAYEELESGGSGGLNQKGSKFSVGATKVLHFINPELFIIIDSNAARAFKEHHNVNFRNSTQPGYSGEKYIECLKYAKKDILDFSVKAFQALEKQTPLTRIYDKLTFITGSNLKPE